MLNKSEYVNRLEMSKMKSILHTLLRESKMLTYKGSFSSPDILSNLYSSRRQTSTSTKRTRQSTTDESENVNFLCIPKFISKKTELSDEIEFRGMPSSNKCIKSLLKEILAMKRTNCMFMSGSGQTSGLTTPNRDQILTEKRWFMFASKVWEAIRKSSLIAEYNRLMT